MCGRGANTQALQTTPCATAPAPAWALVHGLSCPLAQLSHSVSPAQLWQQPCPRKEEHAQPAAWEQALLHKSRLRVKLIRRCWRSHACCTWPLLLLLPHHRDVFTDILTRCDIVTTPGSGFGPGGEGFVRASAFGSRENINEAVRRFKAAFSK